MNDQKQCNEHPGEIPRVRRWRWLAPLVPAVLAMAVLAAACGGSSGADSDGVATAGGSGSKTSDSSKKRDAQQAALDFARCMREHGVDMPDPEVTDDGLMKIGPGAGGGQASEGQLPGSDEAHQACQHHLKDIIQDGADKVDPKEQDRALKFAKCMRDNGVNMPDPDFSKGGATFSVDAGSSFDPSSETFKAAQKACGNLFGPGDGGPGVAPKEGSRS